MSERLRLRLRSEDGFTIVELLVVMVVMGSVLGAMFLALGNLQTTASGQQERLVNLDEARLLMGTVTKDLRTAARLQATEAPFLYADGRRVVFYANINTTDAPNKVTIYVDDESRLVEETVTPTGAAPNYVYDDATKKTRVVGRWIANTEEVFRYYSFDPDTGVEQQILPAPSLTTEQLRLVEAVEVELSVKRNIRSAANATTLISRVRMPNIDYNPLAAP